MITINVNEQKYYYITNCTNTLHTHYCSNKGPKPHPFVFSSKLPRVVIVEKGGLDGKRRGRMRTKWQRKRRKSMKIDKVKTIKSRR